MGQNINNQQSTINKQKTGATTMNFEEMRTAFEAGQRKTEVIGLRDQFAMAALQGLLANPSGPIQSSPMSGWGWCNCEPNDVTNLVYSIADEMLKERDK